MASKLQRQKGCDGVRSTVDAAIQDINLAKNTCGVAPAQVAFGSTRDLLITTGVRFLLSCDDELLPLYTFQFHSASMLNTSPRSFPARAIMYLDYSWLFHLILIEGLANAPDPSQVACRR